MLEWCLRSPRRPPAFSPLARCCRMVAMCLVGDDAGSTECDRIWATAEVCSSYRSSTHRSPTTTSTLLYLSAHCWLRVVAPRDELAIKGRVRWDQCAAAWGCTQNGNHQGSTTVLRKERGKPEPWDQLRGSCLQPLRAFRRDRGMQRSSGGLCAACPTPPAAPHTIVITKLRDARPLRSLSHSLTLVPRSHRRHPRV